MININEIKKAFNSKIVLEDVSLNIESGKCYGLFGNNGAGKTTLTKIIFNELTPDSGTIKVNGLAQSQVNYKEWYFFSENNELPTQLRVSEYIHLQANLYEINKDKIKNYQFEPIRDLLKKKIVDLSAGQKKILSLYICLLVQPKIIFFDEPTANLDQKNKAIILSVIKQLKDSGATMIIISHLIDEVKDLIDHVFIIESGKISYDKKYDQSENIKDIFQKYTNNINSFDDEVRGLLNAK